MNQFLAIVGFIALAVAAAFGGHAAYQWYTAEQDSEWIDPMSLLPPDERNYALGFANMDTGEILEPDDPRVDEYRALWRDLRLAYFREQPAGIHDAVQQVYGLKVYLPGVTAAWACSELAGLGASPHPTVHPETRQLLHTGAVPAAATNAAKLIEEHMEPIHRQYEANAAAWQRYQEQAARAKVEQEERIARNLSAASQKGVAQRQAMRQAEAAKAAHNQAEVGRRAQSYQQFRQRSAAEGSGRIGPNPTYVPMPAQPIPQRNQPRPQRTTGNPTSAGNLGRNLLGR